MLANRLIGSHGLPLLIMPYAMATTDIATPPKKPPRSPAAYGW